MMKAAILKTPKQTGAEMERLTQQFNGDIRYFRRRGTPLNELPLPEYFKVVSEIPYQRDASGIEIVTRPYLILKNPVAADCKKKAILISSYLKNNNIPYRFKAVSSRRSRELHHVLVEANINGQWVEIDATYPRNQLYQKKRWTNSKNLSGNEITSMDSPILVSLYGDGDPSDYLFDQYQKNTKQIYTSLKPYYRDPRLGTLTGAGIVAIVTAAIAAAGTITIGIISAVSDKRSEERSAASQKSQNEFALKLYEAQQADQAAADTVSDEKEKKYITYAGIGLAGFALLKFAFPKGD